MLHWCMIELEAAMARILAALPAAQGEIISLQDGHRRILVEPVRSPVSLPGFDNSAMDGYALRAQDVAAARNDAPRALRLLGRVAAGEVFPEQVGPGTCVRLFTGSPIPKGADSVVMQEDTRITRENPKEILVMETVPRGENIRMTGEDVAAGASLVGSGQILNAGCLSLLAAAGVGHITVGLRTKVGIIATGSELQEPGQSLEPGQIYESNRIGLAALVRQVGAMPTIFPLVSDELSATQEALAKAFEQCDLVVTTGGASVGELDLVRSAFEALGGKIEFWKVAIKPGRPFVFGQIDGRLFFGLPGNPVSALVSFLLLVRPALLRWQGAQVVELPTGLGTLIEPLSNPGSRRHFVRVAVDPKGAVSLAGTQASHMLSSLAAANGLLDLSPQTTIPAGGSVLVRRWDT
jgi:molybdopterin molybdotransferase